MAFERAQITSLDAIAAFRANLLVYLSKARPALDEVGSDMLRTRLWLQQQRPRWEMELRKRRIQLDQAQAELFSAMLSQMREATSFHQMSVRRCQTAVREAEKKLALIRKWDRELDRETEPLLKQVSSLHGFLSADLRNAVATLEEILRTLEAYANTPAPSAATPAEPPIATPEEAP
jgi:hypothetical protein